MIRTKLIRNGWSKCKNEIPFTLRVGCGHTPLPKEQNLRVVTVFRKGGYINFPLL